MTMKYFLNFEGTYIEALTTDILWDSITCTEVPKKNSVFDKWNYTKKEWEIDDVEFMKDLKAKRDNELKRTDKFVLVDYPFDENDKIIALEYRIALRNCLQYKKLPDCPPILKDT